MGLDMYLTKKASVKNWYHNDADERYSVKITKGGVDITHLFGDIGKIESEVCYWRKANWIHKWFVENVQDGKDDCEAYYVSYSNLVDLLSIIDQVLENPSEAHSLLPTQEGFFFGLVDYNEDYFSSLRQTQAMLEWEIKLYETSDLSFEFYYQSSW